MTITTLPLSAERTALSHILNRLMAEIQDLDTLCKHVPRIISVAINTARIQAALISSNQPDETDALRQVLRELSTEEESQW